MTEVLTLPVNPAVLDLYAICKEECFFTQKSDNDFVVFLLNSAVQVVSIVKQFTGQVDFTEKEQEKALKTEKIQRAVEVGQNEEMPTLDDVPRSETTMTIEEFVRKRSIYTASEDECSDSEFKSGSEDSDDNHEYPFSSKESFMLPSLPLVPDQTTSSMRPSFKQRNDPSNLKPFSCHICSFTTKYRSNLSKHITNQHSNKSLPCDQCDFITTKKRALTIHMKRHVIAEPCHDSTEEDSNDEDEDEEEEDVIFKITKDKLIPDQKGKNTPDCKAFVCVLCGRDFTGQTLLDRHMLVHQRKPQLDLTTEEPMAPEGLPAPISVPNKLINSDQTMGCDLCGFVTKGTHCKKNLQRHKNRKHKSYLSLQDLSPRILDEVHQLNAKVVEDTDLVVTRQKQGIGNLIKSGSILPHSNNSYGTPSTTTSVTPSLPTVTPTLQSVTTTFPSISSSLPSIVSSLSSIPSSLPSIPSSLPSIACSLPSITSSLPQLALKIKSLQKASLKRLITPHVSLTPPDSLQGPTTAHLTNVSLHQQDVPLISPSQDFSPSSPGHDGTESSPGHDITENSPGHDTTQSSPMQDMSQISCSPDKSSELPLENDLLDIESNILTPHNPFASEGSWGYPPWQENFPKPEMMDHMFSQDISSIEPKEENPW